MNYEEKYNQALENFKKIKNANSDNKELVNFIEYEYPELRESEEERIRKELIELVHFFYCSSSVYEHHVSEDDMIAWLEKQGEKTIPKNIDDAALQYVDTCAVDGRVTHDNINEPYWNNHSMMAAYKAGWLEKQGEQPSWSEEDKKMLDSIIDCIDGTGLLDFDQIDWLKSIKPNHWKPSEEQMEAFAIAVHDAHKHSYYKNLFSLYNDLKKL